MSREIFFRAKRKDNGEWVEGYYCKTTIGNDVRPSDVIFVPFKVSRNEEWGWMKVDSETICQYTGLTDKNGKKIWEGDIIKYHFGEVYASVKFGEYQSCFDSTATSHVGFYVDWDKNHNFRKDLGYWIKLVDAEVVGNIYDNPELLEEENVHGTD